MHDLAWHGFSLLAVCCYPDQPRHRSARDCQRRMQGSRLRARVENVRALNQRGPLHFCTHQHISFKKISLQWHPEQPPLNHAEPGPQRLRSSRPLQPGWRHEVSSCSPLLRPPLLSPTRIIINASFILFYFILLVKEEPIQHGDRVRGGEGEQGKMVLWL